MTTRTTKHISDEELLARIEADTDEPIGPSADGAPLRAIGAAMRRRDEAETAVKVAVREARTAGMTWASIGATLGMTRQGALKHYGDTSA